MSDSLFDELAAGANPEIAAWVAPLTVYKAPQPGTCPRSPFANGWHRVAVFKWLSTLDGALPGVRLRKICLHCGRMFDAHGFIPLQQPRAAGRASTRRASARWAWR